MADVKAISILSTQIENFKRVPAPPGSLDDVDSYNNYIRKVSDGAQTAVTQVVTYIGKVEEKIQELRNSQKAIIKNNQDAIKKIFATLKPAMSIGITEQKAAMSISITGQKNSLDKLRLAHKLETTSQELMNDRLNELLKETEKVCAKLKDGADFYQDDVEELKGCLKNWEDAKAYSFEEEKRKKLEEIKRREEEKRKRREELEREKKEDAERKKKEEEERKRREREEAERKEEEERRRKEEEKRLREEEELRRQREEEDRKRREREEAERKEEEERRRKEEEERLREEEELRRQREEEERVKREEEERRQKTEEERRRRQEEAARRREEERQRLEAERKESERVQKEAEERAWRQDPNNFKPVTFTRENDEVDGKRVYHGGISCVMTTPPGGIEKDDLECNFSDEVDSIIEIIENDERPISSIIDIKSKKGTLHSEVPSRIYIPHYSMLNAADETIVKLSINGGKWVTISPEQTTTNMTEHEKSAKRMAGVEVNDFSSLKAIVVTRPRCQTIFVDRPGVTVFSSMDKNVKLFVPRDAFPSKTELKLVVQSVSDETLNRLVKEDSSLENVLSISTIICLSCARRPGKPIEIDLIKSSKKQGAGNFQRGKSHQLYTSKDKQWIFADVEFKGNHDDLTITLPAGRERYTIMELDTPSSYLKENVPRIADTLYTCINTTVVRMIVRQHRDDLRRCAVRIVRREKCKDTLGYLSENGYSEGSGESAEFVIKEGQEVEVHCIGNIENASNSVKGTKHSYLSYMGGVNMDMTLRVKDSWKQKDLPAYIGSLRCIVLRDNDSTEQLSSRTIELTVSLPKAVRPRTAIGVARVKFPYYLSSLATYLSQRLCKDDKNIWQDVLRSLLGDSEFSSGYRIARRKSVESNEEPVCRAMLLDWMKTQAVQDDKLSPIKLALKRNGSGDIAESCMDFVRNQKENLSDANLSNLAENITMDVQTLGQTLGIPSNKIERFINQHPNEVEEQYKAVLSEWRESEDVIKHGDKALEYLKNMCP